MKRLGNVWDKIIDRDNLVLAFNKAAKGKRHISAVRRVERNLDYHIDKLQQLLTSGNYKTAPYRASVVYEPKRRVIHSLPFFPDRIVHHAILNVIGDHWDSLFIHDSYACRKNKGQHAGSLRCMEMVRRNNYVLKCDISKFYHSIPHDRLKQVIRKKLKDKKTLALLDEIIDSSYSCEVLVPGHGVPIGNLVSQWLGNLYLNELDMLIKHKYHIKDYVRYCDDFVIFHDDKKVLRSIAYELEEFLDKELHLRFSKCELYPVGHGVDYLGYRHFKTHILVRKSTAKRIRKRMRHIKSCIDSGRINVRKFLGQVDSAMGWLMWANSYHLKLSTDILNIRNTLYEYKQRKEIQ